MSRAGRNEYENGEREEVGRDRHEGFLAMVIEFEIGRRTISIVRSAWVNFKFTIRFAFARLIVGKRVSLTVLEGQALFPGPEVESFWGVRMALGKGPISFVPQGSLEWLHETPGSVAVRLSTVLAPHPGR